nr:HAMP domain-containing protein [Desulfobulbaceae bacterium]
MKDPGSIQVISKSYLSGLIIKCGLFFAGGLVLTGIILYFSAHQPLGPSYQESFARLAQLKQEMLIKSITTYFTLTVLILTGVIFITVLYSHRVVGPLVGLSRTVKEIASGNLAQPAKLREKDAIQPMAEALNAMREAHSEKINLASKQCEAMYKILSDSQNTDKRSAIAEKAKGIKGILFPLKL